MTTPEEAAMMLAQVRLQVDDATQAPRKVGRIGTVFPPVAVLALGLLMLASVPVFRGAAAAQETMDDMHSRLGRQDAIQGGHHRQPSLAEIDERLRHLRMRSEDRARAGSQASGSPAAEGTSPGGPARMAPPPRGEGRR